MYRKFRSGFALVAFLGVSMGIGLYPGRSEALDVTLRVRTSTGSLVQTCTRTSPITTSSDGRTVTLGLGTTTSPVICGGFSIVQQSGAAQAEVVALRGDTQNQVIIRRTLIRYNGAQGSRATLEIEARHTFSLPSPYTVYSARYYGLGFNASFSRNGGLSLASGDRIEKSGFYAYFRRDGAIVEDRIGGSVGAGTLLFYDVPLSGSTTANTIPIPSQQATETGSRVCSNLDPTNNCNPSLERLRTIITVRLNGGDTVTIPNGSHDIAGGDVCEGGSTPPPGPPQPANCFPDTGGQLVETILDILTNARLLIVQNTPVVTVNPFDKGTLTLVLVGSEKFDVRNVVTSSLVFGPAGAVPRSTRLADTAAGKNLSKDGFLDLTIAVNNQDTGIQCGDTTATLTGLYDTGDPNLGDDGFLEFHATVGFATTNCP